ncbi:MAG: lamin tail domain-containing protein [Phycisphaerales bacterium]|nr:MAG: lamin tail domain-containing protein [Phycisphaerales bacterium]
MFKLARLLLALLLLTLALAGPAQADITARGDVVRGVPNDGDWPGAEAPPLAIDDDINTKYLHFKGDTQTTGFQVTPAAGASVVTGLTLTTANDVPGRDPIAFELYGSNGTIDGPYTLIARGDILDFAGATEWPRHTMNETPITFANHVAYSHYQLLFTAVRGPVGGSVNSMQIAEVEFLASPVGGLPPEVNAGENRTVNWRGAGNTVALMQPTIYDDDPCDLAATDPDYLTILWSSLGQTSVDFLGTENDPNAQVLFPAPGVYVLQLQVWDERDQEGADTVTITVVEPECPPGDLSGDCKVDLADLVTFVEQWLAAPGCVGVPDGCADLAGQATDGVDLVDFAALAEHWLADWTAAVRVLISPPEVVSAGAQWRLDQGPWQDSGASVSGLVPGTYGLEFSTVGNWTRPADRTIQVQRNQTTTLAETYAELSGSSLLISEFMPSNETTISTTVAGRVVYPDWIEIYNGGDQTIDLAGWYLTDDPNALEKWACPSVRIEPGEVFLVFASGIQEAEHPENWPYRDAEGYCHTNFKLDADGEYLALVGPDLQVAHHYGSATGDPNERHIPALRADLSYGLYSNQEQYFAEPSPGQLNRSGYAAVSEEPAFSHPAGPFADYILLELSSPNPGATIRYTTDGRVPTANSTAYTGPIPIFATKEVVARAYEPGRAPSDVVSCTYVALAEDLLDFSSDLPIVLVDTERRCINSGRFTKAHSVFMDIGDDGRAGILDEVDYIGRSGLKVRGSSTGGTPKHQYAFEVWDENNLDKDVSLLGMPAESDWILYAPASFDRALINNAFVFELSNQIGRYAVRTRFCEVYLNTNDDQVSASDYVGIYIFMEKIKRGKDRVDVEKLEPWDSTEPQISGGYMLKIDRRDPGDSGFRTSRGNPTYGDGTLCYVDPKEDEITAAQSNWIRNYLDDFEDALYGPDSADPQRGYARFIDVDSWVDHNLLNMLAMNVDALRLSTFISKKRNGKLEMGPLWDFDRALDSTDGRDNNAQSWHGTGDGTDYHNYVWWNELFEDVNFWQKYIDRWYALREGAFSTASLNATIDAMADELREAEVRNTDRWRSYAPRYGGFQGEIDHLKEWLETRCLWVDDQFVSPPRVSPAELHVPSPGTVTLSNPNGYGTIYYTLDGSDPRLPVAGATVLNTTTLVTEDAAKRVLVPTGPVSDAWRGGAAFDDSGWTAGTGGVGYERSSGYQNFFDIDAGTEMYNRNTSCYIRIPFTVADDPSAFNYMLLKMRYDDGFVAYLNGVEIERTAFTGTPTWNSSANGNHDDIAAIRFEDFNVSMHADLLRRGENILAIHGLNSSTTSSDALFSVELIAGQSNNPSGDGIAETALAYADPLVLTESAQITARVLVGSNPYSPWSGLAQQVISVGPVAESLRISEVMYHPFDTGSPDDPNTEYVELTNVGAEPINLNLVAFTNGIDFVFPSVELPAGEYVLVVRDIMAFEAKYGPGLPIAGQYGGSLANRGERIELQDAAGRTIHKFDYRDNWYDLTDGLGFSLTVQDPAASSEPNALDSKSAWRPSVEAEGSPGYGDAGQAVEPGAIVINEIVADAGSGEPDWIELYNTTDRAIEIGGWFLSDDGDDLTKYEIAAGTSIAAGEYLVFYEDLHFGNDNDPGAHATFALSRRGETVYLHSGAHGVLTGYSEAEKFDASETGLSQGRYRKSTGAYNFVPLVEPTPGWANAEPKVGPVVISEIMYNPYGIADAEYVELLNISAETVTLFDTTTGLPWRLTDDPDNPGIEFLFPSDPPVTLAPGECLIVAKDLAVFESTYVAVPDVPVFAWGDGRLANRRERVQLSIPGDDDGETWIRLDRVVYSDGSQPEDFATGVDPWPLPADGFGASLTRIDPTAYGNDPVNWQAVTPTPGIIN